MVAGPRSPPSTVTDAHEPADRLLSYERVAAIAKELGVAAYRTLRDSLPPESNFPSQSSSRYLLSRQASRPYGLEGFVGEDELLMS